MVYIDSSCNRTSTVRTCHGVYEYLCGAWLHYLCSCSSILFPPLVTAGAAAWPACWVWNKGRKESLFCQEATLPCWGTWESCKIQRLTAQSCWVPLAMELAFQQQEMLDGCCKSCFRKAQSHMLPNSCQRACRSPVHAGRERTEGYSQE